MLKDIDFLDEPDKAAVLQCLRAVANFPDIHLNLLSLSNRKPVGLQIWVGMQRSGDSAIANGIPVSRNIMPPLKTHGWVKSLGGGDNFAFTDEAFEWLAADESSPAKLRVAIGKSMYERFRARPSMPIRVVPSEFAAELTASEESVLAEVATLASIGLLRDDTPGGGDEMRFYWFTPAGTQWALSGFPESLLASTQVVVSVVVNVEPYVQQVESLSLDEDVRIRLENVLFRLEAESKKSHPAFAPLRDLLSMMADSAQIAAVAMPLFYQYQDALQRIVG